MAVDAPKAVTDMKVEVGLGTVATGIKQEVPTPAQTSKSVDKHKKKQKSSEIALNYFKLYR